MAHDIFISYTQPDKIQAFAVHDMFEANGLQSWIATSREHGIAPGDDFEATIVKAVAASKIFVLVYSKHCNNSQHVKRELRQMKDGQQLLIVRLDNSDYHELLSYYLAGAQWMDATVKDPHEILNDLLRATKKAMGIFKPAEFDSTDKFLLNNGLKLLQNKMYREAEKELHQYGNINPGNSFAKFALVISMIRARNTRKLGDFEAERMQEILVPHLTGSDNTCIKILLAIIKNGYYTGNGFRQTMPSSEELVYRILPINRDENAGIIIYHLHPEDLVWVKRNKLYNF